MLIWARRNCFAAGFATAHGARNNCQPQQLVGSTARAVLSIGDQRDRMAHPPKICSFVEAQGLHNVPLPMDLAPPRSPFPSNSWVCELASKWLVFLRSVCEEHSPARRSRTHRAVRSAAAVRCCIETTRTPRACTAAWGHTRRSWLGVFRNPSNTPPCSEQPSRATTGFRRSVRPLTDYRARRSHHAGLEMLTQHAACR